MEYELDDVPNVDTFSELLAYNLEWLTGKRKTTYYYGASAIYEDQLPENLITINNPNGPYRLFTVDGQGKLYGENSYFGDPTKTGITMQRSYLNGICERKTAYSLAKFLKEHTDDVQGIIFKFVPENVEKVIYPFKILYVDDAYQYGPICFTKYNGNCTTGLKRFDLFSKVETLNDHIGNLPPSLFYKNLYLFSINSSSFESNIKEISRYLIDNWNPRIIGEESEFIPLIINPPSKSKMFNGPKKSIRKSRNKSKKNAYMYGGKKSRKSKQRKSRKNKQRKSRKIRR